MGATEKHFIIINRIVTEARTNVLRHARARTCTVRLEASGALRLLIADDGQGLPDAYEPGVGLDSMHERAAELGGLWRGGGSTWVSVDQQAELNGRTYYHVRWGWRSTGWMAAEVLSFSAPLSQLRGVELQERPGERLAMAYTPVNVRTEPGVITEATRIGVLRPYDLIVHEERWVNGAIWYRIGDQQGLFQTRVKYSHGPMSWTTANPPYSLADVPWMMYFHISNLQSPISNLQSPISNLQSLKITFARCRPQKDRSGPLQQ